MHAIFRQLEEAERRALREQDQPAWIAPMLATLTRDTFSHPDWIFERKLDGIRALAFRRGEEVRLLSRNRLALGAAYPELVQALARQRCRDFVVDGEIVAFEGGRTSFERLQRRIGVRSAAEARRSGVAVCLYLFDVLHLEGCDVTRLPLVDRKWLLRRALVFGGPLRFTPHRAAAGEQALADACRKGWEGVIAKRAGAPYTHGRSRDWLKFKCGNRQELVIGGYTEPRGARTGFGALLVGYYEGEALRYAGKVGTGYDEALLASLAARLARLERPASPFDPPPRERGAHWVEPRLVGEVGFTEWTRDGKLRHPRFLGLRPDKEARAVHRERPRPAPI